MSNSPSTSHSHIKDNSRLADERALQDDERKHLLSGTDNDENDIPPELIKAANPFHSSQETWPSRRVAIISVIFLTALIFGGIFALSFFYSAPKKAHLDLDYNGHTLRSNGTHSFKRTVVVVSIDGLRADYLDRGLTPHLLAISKKGLRAKWMKPIFPSQTFPNHWALMTGLYAESHGIVANNFWDPITEREFRVRDAKTITQPSWWLGEPMWETAEKVGIKTANLMWPGPPKTVAGTSPTYFIPWQNHTPLKIKHDQIMEWIDMPFDERPQLITAYEDSLDQAGHQTGPNSLAVNQTLTTVDVFAKNLHDSLALRNLSDIVDIVFVSDHGMTDMRKAEIVWLDDIMGEDFKHIEHQDGWPAVGLWLSPQANISRSMEILLSSPDAIEGKFDVYTHDTMPTRYHFSNNPRIAPIYVVPKMGYALSDHIQGDDGVQKGVHGYDNDYPAMRAMFVAHGPFSAVTKAVHQSHNTLARRVFGLPRPNKGWHSTSDDTYVMNGFQNLEVYGLVMKLLGVAGDKVAPTNGTSGFWDVYF